MQRTGARVAVFDGDMPPGIAFIRSLGEMNVPVSVYGSRRVVPGRYSRFTESFHRCPPVHRHDELIPWLIDEIGDHRIDLVAPTSDNVSFAIAEAMDEGVGPHIEVASSAAIRTCLFKVPFLEAMTVAGFDPPAWCAPTSLEQALNGASELGYPLVLKPRSHVGIGLSRGVVVHNEVELRDAFHPYASVTSERALRHDPDLAWPFLQRYSEPDDVDVISVTGFLGRNGAVRGVDHCRKIAQSPPRLGIGTLFESVDEPPFTEQAVAAVRSVLQHGLFELEVLVDRRSGACWPIDLNPRAYGQISLNIARGNDLPTLWYRSVTNADAADVALPAPPPPEDEQPRMWLQGAQFFVGAAVRMVIGPGRRDQARQMYRYFRYPTVGAVLKWYDLGPSIVFALLIFRHPGGLIRPFLRGRTKR